MKTSILIRTLDGEIPFKWLLPALIGSDLWGIGKGLLEGLTMSVFVCWVHLLAHSVLGLGMRRRKEIRTGVGLGLGPSIDAADISWESTA